MDFYNCFTKHKVNELMIGTSRKMVNKFIFNEILTYPMYTLENPITVINGAHDFKTILL